MYDLGELPVYEPFLRYRRVGPVRLLDSSDSAPGAESDILTGMSVRQMIEKYGADAVRLLLLVSGPVDRPMLLRSSTLLGIRRFLSRVWTQCEVRLEKGKFVSRRMLVRKHLLIHEVTRSLAVWNFPRAVAELMKFARFLGHPETTPEEMDRKAMETFLVVLSPFAPFLADEVWSRMGHEKPLATAPWPMASDELVHPPEREYPVFVDGRLRDRMQQPSNLEPTKLESRALDRDRIRGLLGGREVKRVVVVPQGLINIVLGES